MYNNADRIPAIRDRVLREVRKDNDLIGQTSDERAEAR